ncbi:CDP-alcohol phosphatidyltransferase family protein [Micromonospora sp. ATA32]|nr:CDP-alcohol phosphatidyltransferase family protein [Micromonospora sp. ATA32]
MSGAVDHSHGGRVSTVRTGPVIGLIVQIVLLAGLAWTVGLGGAGWLAGAAYGAVMCVALTRGLRRSGPGDLRPADRVTLTRGVLVGGVAALTVDSFGRPAPVGVMVVLTVVALALDAVDGYVARRTGTASTLGARFDMEVDAFLILVLSLHVAPAAGGWVLTMGAMRYAFVAASWVLPWMRGSLPPRFWRKVVAAAQGIVLAAAMARVAARVGDRRGAGGVAGPCSSNRSVGTWGWLWRHRPSGSPVRGRPRAGPGPVAPSGRDAGPGRRTSGRGAGCR